MTLSSIPPTSSDDCALFQGRERHYYEIDWKGRRIWGATAAMLVNLSRQAAMELKLDAAKWLQRAAASGAC